jgi:hypothetical protein
MHIADIHAGAEADVFDVGQVLDRLRRVIALAEGVFIGVVGVIGSAQVVSGKDLP